MTIIDMEVAYTCTRAKAWLSRVLTKTLQKRLKTAMALCQQHLADLQSCQAKRSAAHPHSAKLQLSPTFRTRADVGLMACSHLQD